MSVDIKMIIPVGSLQLQHDESGWVLCKSNKVLWGKENQNVVKTLFQFMLESVHLQIL